MRSFFYELLKFLRVLWIVYCNDESVAVQLIMLTALCVCCLIPFLPLIYLILLTK